MATDAIVFACANPVPEIWPWDALEAGRASSLPDAATFPIRSTIRSVSPASSAARSTCAPAPSPTDGASLPRAELAACAAERGLSDTHIAPRMDDWDVVPRLAVATATQAQTEGVARLTKSREELYAGAVERVTQARAATDALVRAGVIRPMPEAG